MDFRLRDGGGGKFVVGFGLVTFGTEDSFSCGVLVSGVEGGDVESSSIRLDGSPNCSIIANRSFKSGKVENCVSSKEVPQTMHLPFACRIQFAHTIWLQNV